jgi:aflatoxin B1 aldehyde reductase
MASSKQAPNLILGCASFGLAEDDPFVKTTTAAQAADLFRLFASYGHETVDSSRRYPPTAPGTSEQVIGGGLKLLQQSILVDTKVLSAPGCHEPSKIATSIAESLAALGATSVHTIYLHYPDRTRPLTDPISALSRAVSEGQAQRWGVSNYTFAEVEEMVALCDRHGWIRPAVYQGEYNLLNREAERDMIPFCHDHGIAFYAYSPGAGGVVAPTGTRITAEGPVADHVRAKYGDQLRSTAIQKVRDAATDHGLSAYEVAIRWAVWDGALQAGDGVVVGASSPQQLKQTCEAVRKGGLAEELKSAVEGVWVTIQQKDKQSDS